MEMVMEMELVLELDKQSSEPQCQCQLIKSFLLASRKMTLQVIFWLYLAQNFHLQLLPLGRTKDEGRICMRPECQKLL